MARCGPAWIAVAIVLLAGCARPRPVALPPGPARIGYEETGLASWYGNPFHGRRTASGEVYDMTEMTAAHRTLPFNTWLIVENLNNHRTVEVRVNDRGPFAGSRILDLSYGAARLLGATGPGVVPIRLRVLGGSTSAPVSRDRAFAVQVGAFSAQDKALALQRELAGTGTEANVQQAEVGGRTIYRVRVGRFASSAEATATARRLAQGGYAVIVVAE
ncbi:MAG: septal ring lytic transglycosylase RlpA family lipoprotein [Candidatus Rokuibacteriota bacterium]|nr:MAG: septal ring lytic transglycosylase RlpA family lipoprotein [Candidatus Rokubacteria bacterium]PYM65891.1 MAG: septal ring lytic transglycosylase RlpA family lipoprotein [Candidatus Rokubacteria bacterium]PYN67137.1 MAG: septal ring lytic transglycosylase RlpA family lipoprotein [Candidatus Rokubacteria bacterium]